MYIARNVWPPHFKSMYIVYKGWSILELSQGFLRFHLMKLLQSKMQFKIFSTIENWRLNILITVRPPQKNFFEKFNVYIIFLEIYAKIKSEKVFDGALR